jgi:hypothetical protein
MKKVTRIPKKVFAIVIVAALLILGVSGAVYAYRQYSGNKAAEATNEEMPTPTTEEALDSAATNDPFADLKLSLTVDIDRQTLETMYTGFIRDFLDSSMPNRNAERTVAASHVGWGKEGQKMYDAVTFPFSVVQRGKTEYSDEDIDKMYLELQEEIMRNPVMGDMVIQGLEYMALTDGTKMSELNEDWVQDFLAIYDEKGCGAFVTYHTYYWQKYGFELPHDGEDVEAWKAEHPNAPVPTEAELELIPLDDDENLTPDTNIQGAYGRAGMVAKPANVYKLYVTEYYARSAKRVLAFLDRCNIDGVETYSTTTHWVLNSTQNANKVRTHVNEDKTYVDKQPALVFSVLTKDSKRQLLFGFNIYDMRLEIFERTASPVKPDPDPQPRPEPTPDPVPNPDPTPDPTPTPVPDPDPTPTPDPTPDPDPDPTGNKDPYDDPVHHDNADKGGGEGQGETGDPTPDPSLRDMEDAHGGPDQNQGHSDPSTVKPGPNPSDTHTDNIGNADDNNPNTVEHHDEQQMDYGQENHDQHDSVTDTNGNTSNPDEQPAGGDFDEPPIG